MIGKLARKTPGVGVYGWISPHVHVKDVKTLVSHVNAHQKVK